jgi:threonine dehydrogenase-like Zn-dependent dehydrogenase
VLLGLGAKAVPVLPLRFVRRGLTLAGSLIYDHPTDFEQAIDLVGTGRVRPSAAVSHVLGLENAAAALELVVGGQAGKVLLDIGSVDQASG